MPTVLPLLSRSKRFSLNWAGTVTPIKNYQYFFGFDEEVRTGILTGLQPELSATLQTGVGFSNYDSVGSNNVNAYKYAYITLVNNEGEIVIDNLPVMSLFVDNLSPQITPGLVIRTFCVNVDPSKSYITFNYNTGDLPIPMPTGINFTWYYKKRII